MAGRSGLSLLRKLIPNYLLTLDPVLSCPVPSLNWALHHRSSHFRSTILRHHCCINELRKFESTLCLSKYYGLFINRRQLIFFSISLSTPMSYWDPLAVLLSFIWLFSRLPFDFYELHLYYIRIRGCWLVTFIWYRFPVISCEPSIADPNQNSSEGIIFSTHCNKHPPGPDLCQDGR